MTPECKEKTPKRKKKTPIPIAKCLRNSFRVQFENLLKQLKNDAILSSRGMPITTNEVASTGVPTKTDEVASPGMPAITDEKQGQSSSTQPWYFRKELGPRVSSKFSTKARGKLVADIRGELKRYKKQLDSLPKDYEKLAKRYPKCIVFDIYLRHPEKRSDFDECILYTQPAELSYIMASAVAGVGRDAIKAAWDNCR